jgi:putative flippase GtrA
MLTRWLRFNIVGIGGSNVQLAVLLFLTRALGLGYIGATVLAVEIAILHNFCWHEVWTWPGGPAEERWRRLVRFHLANGCFSIASNVPLTWAFKEWTRMPLLLANFTAIASMALINFALAYAWVFRGRRSLMDREP